MNAGVYEQIGRVFAKTKRYEEFLGGLPVEDVAVYYSDDSRFRPEDNGRAVADASANAFAQMGTYPHVVAVSGAVRQLQHDHIPFGAITRSQLDRLGEYRVVVLPDVLRMDDEEIERLRAYVAGGGSLYASGRTSLLAPDGVLRDDFGLSDVFGVHVDGIESGHGVYSRALDPLIAEAVHPESHLAHGFAARGSEPCPTQNAKAHYRTRRASAGSADASLRLPLRRKHVGTRLRQHSFVAAVAGSGQPDDRLQPVRRWERGVLGAADRDGPGRTRTNGCSPHSFVCCSAARKPWPPKRIPTFGSPPSSSLSKTGQ